MTSIASVTTAQTFYAHWTESGGVEPGDDSCSVTFNANGGSVKETRRTVASGAAVGDLPEPTRTGYVFSGWWTAAEGGVRVDASYVVDSSVTLYAHWMNNREVQSRICEDAFSGIGTVELDDNDNIVVMMSSDVNGTVEIPDNVGRVMIDLNGHSIVGADGRPAILVVPGDGAGETSQFTIFDTSDGEKGTVAGNGESVAINIADDAARLVLPVVIDRHASAAEIHPFAYIAVADVGEAELVLEVHGGFDCHYRFLYSSMIQKNDVGRRWEETNFEINGGVKTDLYQYGKYSPFLACEMLTNKYKGYDLKLSGLLGLKLRVFTIPSFCDYSVSAAFVFDWNDFTDDVSALLNNNYRISIRPKIKQKLADNLALLHYTFFQPSVLDLSDYIIYSETKLQTQITKKLFLDFSFRYDYHSRVPLETYRHHDILTEVSIRYKN